MQKTALSLAISFAAISAHAEHSPTNIIEEVVVEGQRQGSAFSIEMPNQPVVDSTELLKKVPGANINSNGPLTGIPQIRGLFAQRVNTSINGSKIASGGPNWMDPPLHYAPAALVENLTVYRGIAPVSVGQETIGGAIKATTWKGDFSETEQVKVSGKLIGSYQSVNQSTEFATMTAVANQNHRGTLTLLDNRGDDTEFPEGTIEPTEFERQRGEIAYAYQRDQHFLSLSYMRNETDEAGTPALPMDIEYVDTDSSQLIYKFSENNWGMAVVYNEAEVEHNMTNYHLRPAPMNLRSTLATGDSNDASLSFWFKQNNTLWRSGLDMHSSEHNADISDPSNAMFFVQNFNQAEKDTLGVYLEMENQINEKTQVNAGIRVNQVEWDSAEVNGTPAMMNPAAQMMRDNFNAADRSDSDTNVDLVFGAEYQIDEHYKLVATVGQKNRTASYQERFLWLPMMSTAGLADGNTYIGNVDLKTETSKEIDFGFDYQSHSLFVSPRIFYKKIDDYIQGTPVTNPMVIMFSNMMMGDPTPLQFNNIEATLYGADLEVLWQFADHWRFESVVSYVRGIDDENNEDLYRIAPLNGTFATVYVQDSWSVTIEAEAAAEQNKVAEINNESTSEAYVAWNLRAQKQLTESLLLSGGIENLLDKKYAEHLSGVNRVTGSDVAVGDRIPAAGRNLYLQMSYSF